MRDGTESDGGDYSQYGVAPMQSMMATSMMSRWQKQAVAFLCFSVFYIALNEFNPWALKAGQFPGFAFPVFYSMFHMLFSSLAAWLLLYTVAPPSCGGPSLAQLREYGDGLMVIAICTALNVGLNNLSLTLVSLFINQVIKASSPLPTMVFEALLARKRFSLAMIVTVLVICVGCVLAPFFKLSHSASDGNSALGVLAVLVAMLASSLKPVVGMIYMQGTPQRPSLSPTLLLFYDTSLSLCFMLVYCGHCAPPSMTPSIMTLTLCRVPQGCAAWPRPEPLPPAHSSRILTLLSSRILTLLSSRILTKPNGRDLFVRART